MKTLQDLFPLAVVLVVLGVPIWRLSIRHSTVLFGWRISTDTGSTLRIIIQNLESITLLSDSNDKFFLDVVADDVDARFTEPVEVMAGPSQYTINRSDHRSIRLLFTEINAFDTWVVICRGNSALRNVTITSGELRDGRQIHPIAGVRSRRVRLPGNGDQAAGYAGPRHAPSGFFASCLIVAAVALYLAPFVIPLDIGWPSEILHDGFSWTDGIYCSLIVLGGIILWLACRVPTPPLVQGYTIPTPPGRMTR